MILNRSPHKALKRPPFQPKTHKPQLGTEPHEANIDKTTQVHNFSLRPFFLSKSTLITLTSEFRPQTPLKTMLPELSPIECRVLGCLIEKAHTTPEYYPLSLNSLVNACNQKSNRNPQMDLDEDNVNEALENLRAEGFAFRVDTTGSRTAKFKYQLPEDWALDLRHTAILCELLVRGPQTPGELKNRADRITSFRDLAEVQEKLQDLETLDEHPLAQKLPLQPGKKEARFIHLLSGQPDIEAFTSPTAAVAEPAGPSRSARIEQLEIEVATLKTEIAELKSQFATFKSQFE